VALFQTERTSLYSIAELFAGYDPAKPISFRDTPDFQIYKAFVADKGTASINRPEVLKRAEHDCSITELFAAALTGKKVVAIMGGHNVLRGSPAYESAAKTAARLADEGFLVISGGGPGAMEAVHLGAAVGKDDNTLADFLKRLKALPPEQKDCSGFPVVYTGKAPDKVTVSDALIEKLAGYYAPGWQIRQEIGHGGGIAVPTWMYGWEPTTVFADGVAKYFQNISAEGRAGTLQEVFQDAAQNYYRSFPAPSEQAGVGVFSPMVFLGRFWRWTVPVEPILQGLFALGSVSDEEAARVVFTDSIDEAVKTITNFKGPPVPPALL
jgi:hypothetical protein